MSLLGIRKSGQVRSLCRIMDRLGLNYDVLEIQNMSTLQLRKKIKELGGGRRGNHSGRLSDQNTSEADGQ